MLSQKTRVDVAREAFLRGNKQLAEASHGKKAIQKSILHREEHKTSFNLPEIILGGQDGLVNVLGVILGVAAATADTRIIIVAGMAATFAESISMGAVAYTSRLAEADYYQSEYEREKWEIEHLSQGEKEEIRSLYQRFGFSGRELESIVDKITANKKIWLEVMMSQELKLEPVERKQALPTGILVGISALIGSFIPLLPFLFTSVKTGMFLALIFSSLTLFAVGYYKAKVTLGRNLLKQGIEMTVIGIVSALVGYLVGSLFKIPPTAQ